MREIVLAGEAWATREDFYSSLLRCLGAPNWHGHNLDALRDSITGRDINQVNLPFGIRITGIDAMPEDCRILVDRFVAMILGARAEGFPVEVACS